MGNFKLNSKGVQELLKSPEMQNLVNEYTQAALAKCGPHYEADVQVGKYRAIGMVKASSFAARKDNSINNTLLKAL